MNKKYLYHLWTLIRPLRVWYFLLAFAVSTTFCVLALRQNNLGMVRLREAVYVADKDGGNVEQALRDLRKYVYAHMNTNLSSGGNTVYPPVQLKYTYERLVAAESARVNQANSQIYTDAQTTCERRFPGSVSGGPRVPCIQEYVTTHGVTAKKIPDSLYKFSFSSPTWSSDAAGWLLALSGLLLVLAVIRFILGWLLKRLSKT